LTNGTMYIHSQHIFSKIFLRRKKSGKVQKQFAWTKSAQLRLLWSSSEF
jgi:hypothetical protein